MVFFSHYNDKFAFAIERINKIDFWPRFRNFVPLCNDEDTGYTRTQKVVIAFTLNFNSEQIARFSQDIKLSICVKENVFFP